MRMGSLLVRRRGKCCGLDAKTSSACTQRRYPTCLAGRSILSRRRYPRNGEAYPFRKTKTKKLDEVITSRKLMRAVEMQNW